MKAFMQGGVLLAAMLVGACGGTDAATSDRRSDTAPAATVAATAQVTGGDVAAAPATDTTRAAGGPRRVTVFGVDLTGIGYDRGSTTAPVVVVNFSDFGCPYCAKFAQESEPAIDEEYVSSGKVFIKYVPFVMGMFPNGGQAARAAECAGDQGKFQAMHDRLYATQSQWKRSSDPNRLFARYATELQLDGAAFAACYARPGMHPRTVRANEAAENLGVRATPSFLVNDRGIEGAPPLQSFRDLLDAAVEGRL